MNLNKIYNTIIGIFLISGIYNLSACSFNGTGLSGGVVITTSSASETTESQVDTLSVYTTSPHDCAPTTSSTTTLDPIDSSTSISTISMETTYGVTTTTGYLTTFDDPTNTTDVYTTEIPVGNCGDCILQDNEECDWCIYPSISGITDCLKESKSYLDECVLQRGPVQLLVGEQLKGMMTPQYDKEEADLLCKIIAGTNDFESEVFKFSQGDNGLPHNTILPFNINNQGILLKSIQSYYNLQPLYYYPYGTLPDFLKNETYLYIDSCKLI